MSERTAAYAPSVADTYDFSDVRTVADLGGGTGTLLVEILRRHRTSAASCSRPRLLPPAPTPCSPRPTWPTAASCWPETSSSPSPPRDCYLLANVLHDWDDARSFDILRNCRQAMSGAGRVLIVERLIPEDGTDPVPTLLSDINMLVLTGGRERTNAEYSQLLTTADLQLGSVQPVASPYGVIEGLAA